MPGKTFKVILIFVVGLFSAMQLHAQEVFVKDSLRVGVRSEPGNTVAPVSVVTTGMKLTVLEESGNYLKIKSEKGLVGWVKKTYVSPEPPARFYLQKLQEKYQKLDAELVEQSKKSRAAELNVQTLNEEISQLKKHNAELRVQIDDAQKENSVVNFSYLWKVGLFLLICIAGFAAGVVWHRSYAMKRLGGLRV